MTSYEDFCVTVNGEPGSYQVEARGPGEISIAPLPFAFDQDEFALLQTELESIKNGEAPSRQQMQAVGALLFSALMPRKILRGLARSYDELPPEKHLRLKLAIRPPELNILPWELLYDPDEENFLAARLSTPIVRMVESGVPSASLLARRPLRVLYVQAAPSDLPELDLMASENALRQALGKHAEIVSLRAATPPALRQALRQPFHILHYDGHAMFDASAGAGYLCLQDENGYAHQISGELLATYLEGTPIRLVTLAACESGMDSQEKRFAGIAQQLMKSSNLPAAIAMQFSIPDRSAIAFVSGFYGALADDYPIDAAVTEGRKAILELIGGEAFTAPDWATAVLFLRAKDSDIFGGGASKTASGAQTKSKEEKGMKNEKKSQNSGIQIGKGSTIQGDVFTGGKKSGVSIGSISNVSGGQLNVAGGDIHTTTVSGSGGLTIAQVFEQLTQKVNSLPDGPAKMMAATAVQGLKTEADKGGQADEKTVAQWLGLLAPIAPEIHQAALANFRNPPAGLSPVFKKAAG